MYRGTKSREFMSTRIKRELREALPSLVGGILIGLFIYYLPHIMLLVVYLATNQ